MKKYLVLCCALMLSGCASWNSWSFDWDSLNPWSGEDAENATQEVVAETASDESNSWWNVLKFWSGNEQVTESETISEQKLPSNVNKYLWNASIDKLTFMGVETENADEGLIVTNWKVLNNAPNEKFKIAVEIKDGELRADALDVKVYKEVRTKNGWIKTAPSPEFAYKVEQAIIKQAKILYKNDMIKE